METSQWLVLFAVIGAAGALLGMWLLLRVTRYKEQCISLREQLTGMHGNNTELQNLLALAQKDNAHLREQRVALETQKEVQAKAQEAMKLEFQATAQKLFDEISRKFSHQSEEKIGALVKPLQERMVEFQKKVDDAFGTQGKETHSLKNEIEKIMRMNESMRLSTESLTKALRGDVKAQGNWGEVILERILEASGLQEGLGYTLQAADMGLKAESGNTAMPDVIVHLPDDKHIIIDSKVSLLHYERYSSETDEQQKAQYLKLFMQSVRAHVKNLSSKNYAGNAKLVSPDFVLLFMPIEGAYSLAVQQDVQMHSDAWEQKVSIVCPSTLFATLRTISSLWRIELQNRNAEEIARQAGALYDKFVGLFEDLDDMGRKLQQADESHENVMKKLRTGKGNLVSRVENIKKLGGVGAKQLPKELLLTSDSDE